MAPGRRKKINRLINCRENIEDVFILQEKKQLERQRGSRSEAVDRISELPDDIVVSIISLLTHREAKATKILSMRWRRLDPTGNTISLNFPFPMQWKNLGDFDERYVRVGDVAKLSDHTNRMNRWLESYNYKGSQVIKLVAMDIPSPKMDYGRKLIDFELSMETETLVIRMVYDSSSLIDTPCPLYYIRKTLTPLVHPKLSTPGLKSIKELCLFGVVINRGGDISLMVRNLVALERLSIGFSHVAFGGDLVIVSVPKCKLKHVLLSNLTGGDKFCVGVCDALNLVSFKCDGLLDVHAFYLDNLPKLAHLRALTATHDRRYKWDDLCLRLRYNSKTQGNYEPFFKQNNLQIYTPLNHLRHLELNIVMAMDKGSSCGQQLFRIIEAFPYLEKLGIKFKRPTIKPKNNDQQPELMRRKKLYEKESRVGVNNTIFINFHLETVRLTDFSGSVFELEFVLFIIHNIEELQELTVEACVTSCPLQRREIAWSFRHLLSVTPTSVDLILKDI